MRTVKLGDICSKIGSGATPKGGKNVYTEAGTALIRSQNIYNLDFAWEGLARISDDAALKLANVTLKQEDVLLNITGDSVARVCVVPKEVLPARVNQHVAIIRPNPEILDPKYLALYLASPYMQSYMLNRAAGKGASRNAITRDMITSFEVPAPSLDMQRRIISRLSTYDSLIENNRKQIKLLEEAAQRLYKEWFIDLRFPGHEDAEINPETGLPEGWTLQTFDDVCESIGGGTPSTSVSSYWENGTIPWVTPSDVTNNAGLYLPKSEKCITQEGLNNSSARLLPKQAILMTSRASIGYIAICDMPVSTNQGFISCIPRHDHLKWWLVHELHNRAPEFKLLAKGSTFLELSRSTFRKMKVILPSRQVLELFSSTIEIIFDAEMAIRREIDFLIEARDRLLPKLMEGEVEL